jgi:hypothetical protein
MQEIEKIVGIKVEDFKLLVPNLKAGFSHAVTKYHSATTNKMKMVDSLVFLSLALFVIQVTYGIVLGRRDPFNSFIAGTFCSLGIFAMTMSLRI